jgi:hypothetical protein
MSRAAIPITCPNGGYCGYHPLLDVLGCCASYHTTSSTEVVLDSCNYQLACTNGDDFDGNCDEACQSNELILKW